MVVLLRKRQNSGIVDSVDSVDSVGIVVRGVTQTSICPAWGVVKLASRKRPLNLK